MINNNVPIVPIYAPAPAIHIQKNVFGSQLSCHSAARVDSIHDSGTTLPARVNGIDARRMNLAIWYCGVATVVSISEDSEWVHVEYIDASENHVKVRSRYLVGTDGKTGYTRKHYLEPKGVVMADAAG